MTADEMRAFLRSEFPDASADDIEGGVYWFTRQSTPTYKPGLHGPRDGEVRCYHALIRKLT